MGGSGGGDGTSAFSLCLETRSYQSDHICVSL